MKLIDTVLFDLDGTLVDTAPDMALALEILCEEQAQPKLAFDAVRPRVSDGSAALVKLAFGEDLDTTRLEQLKQRYLAIYEANLVVRSTPFPKIRELLQELTTRSIQWGVVTNKPGWLTTPLLEQLGLAESAACIVSGDCTANRKPHPEPMYRACELAGSTPQQCLYVGDALRDIEAGNNAGMKTLIAAYGYIDSELDITRWQADGVIQQPSEVLQYTW